MKARRLLLADLFSHPANFLSLGFGSGLVPWAPGTFGTLAAIPVYLLLSTQSLNSYLVVTLLVSLVGIWLCGKTADDLGVHDHGGIVWDEIAGFLITMIALPVEWPWILAGFALFRFFDILKPWPIKWLDQHVKGGFGIMIDDVLAGLMSLALLHIALRVI